MPKGVMENAGGRCNETLPWPPSMALIAEKISAEVALALAGDFGGSQVYVPKKPRAKSRLVSCIGLPNVQRLVDLIGYGDWQVPICRAVLRHRRNEAIRADFRAEGASMNKLAVKYGLHVRMIARVIHATN